MLARWSVVLALSTLSTLTACAADDAPDDPAGDPSSSAGAQAGQASTAGKGGAAGKAGSGASGGAAGTLGKGGQAGAQGGKGGSSSGGQSGQAGQAGQSGQAGQGTAGKGGGGQSGQSGQAGQAGAGKGGAAQGGQAGAAGSNAGGAGAPMATRGATLPYVELEAETAETNGTILGPSRKQGDIAAESSGRRAVRLDAVGQHVRFVLPKAASSIVVRYVVPDAPGGGGIDATLGLYVGTTRIASLPLTSRYAWVYGGESSSSDNQPGPGAHHFYDEARARFDLVPAGTTVTLQKDAEDTAAYYVVDLVDFEEVPAAIGMPAGALSVLDFGAKPDDGGDDGPALQKAIDAGRAQQKDVYLPPGRYRSATAPLAVRDVTVRGAGMWHTVVEGPFARFDCGGSGCRYRDFALLGETKTRDDQGADNGFNGGAGKGSLLENVWVEHTKCGWWVGKNTSLGPGERPTDGLVIRNSRIRNTFADGVNLCNGASNSVVEQTHLRNTGDDALATWSPSFDGPPGENNVFRFNTVQIPWRANCFAIYGGKDHRIEDNVCSDVVMYPGVLVSSGFSAHPFAGTTSILRTTLTRAGGSMYGQEHGALKLFGDQSDVAGIVAKDLLIEDATYSGVHVQGPKKVSGQLAAIQVTGGTTAGIRVEGNAVGSLELSGVAVSGYPKGAQNDAAGFQLVKGAGNTGW